MQTEATDPGARLMLAYQRGDEAAFDRLVEGFSGQVYALLTRFMGPVAEREDLVQEVFLRVIRARRGYRPTARFSTWLYRIAFNLCVNARARAGRDDVSIDTLSDGAVDWPDEGALEPSGSLEREDVVRAVKKAIAALPERQRMAVILAKYEELSYADIATVLDSSEKAVKSMIHRARENLRALLAPFLEEEPA